MKYEQLKQVSKEEAMCLLLSKDNEVIKLLPLSIGEYHDDFDFAESFCLKLLSGDYCDEVKANAVLGLSYLVRRFRIFNKGVMPSLRKEQERNRVFSERIAYSIEDIELFMEM